MAGEDPEETLSPKTLVPRAASAARGPGPGGRILTVR
jgi:hypothetical protein